MNNINDIDLLLLTNKVTYNKYVGKKSEYTNIINDVIKYKKEIKIKMNKLIDNYLQAKNVDKLLKSKNDTEKYRLYFYYFLSSLIETIKHQEFKKQIQLDLSGVSNNNDVNINTRDISNTLFKDLITLDVNFCEINSDLNNSKRISNLNNFISYRNKANKLKILPKKR